MTTIIHRLILQLALGAAFGAGQLVFSMAATHASLALTSAPQSQNAVSVTKAPDVPVGLGWG